MLKKLILLLVCLAPLGAYARTITVDSLGGGDYATISDAIDAAKDGDVIAVSPGAYAEAISFGGLAITLMSLDPEDPAIVASTVIVPASGYAVSFTRSEGPASVLTGFTILSGGIRCSGASTKPIILGNIITGCDGVGISGALNTAPSIIGNEISYNGGGGIYLCDGLISANVITGNQATRGAGLYDCDGVIRNNIISGNLAIHTSTQGDGGGLWGCDGTIENNTIVGNIARNDARPTTHGFGGGLFNCQGIVRNNILAGNIANSGGGIYALAGTINNSFNAYSENVPDPFAGGMVSGTGELSTDPLFIVEGAWDDAGTTETGDDFWVEGEYHLKSGTARWDPTASAWVQDATHSLCIDAGDPNSDWSAEIWRHGERINMGAYGGTPEASMSLSTLGMFADFDHDGRTDCNDLAMLAEKWLSDEAPLAEDLTRNGGVDLRDLALLLDHWTEAPAGPRPPDPDPMRWAVQPYATGPYSIKMTAMTAFSTDGTGVEYRFVDLNYPLVRDSNWVSFDVGQQASWEFTDLNPGSWYYFHVKARNKGNQLETAFSSIKHAQAENEDLIAPSPNPATWATAPYPTSSDSIRMVATTATDDQGVEYYFECTSHPTVSSEWQDSPEYVLDGLAKGEYTFRVRYRDKSLNQNMGNFSVTASVDFAPPTPDPMEWEEDGEPVEVKIGTGSFDYYATMTCVEAEDGQDEIEYYFQCVDELGLSSGWIKSTTYTVKVGRTGQALRFRVKARDELGNETGWSTIVPAL